MAHILIVDDEAVIAEFLGDLLIDEGHEVQIARSGREALEQLQQIHPHLILSDIMMPGMTGLELCREIQQSPTYQSIPIILMSAVIRPPDHHLCRPRGFLSKPIDFNELLDMIGEIAPQPAPPT